MGPTLDLICDHAVLVSFAEQASLDASDRAHRFFYRLRRGLAGVTGIHPGYVSVLVDFDPRVVRADALLKQLEKILNESKREPSVPGDLVSIAVQYDGEDLDDVARLLGLTTEEVVRLHTGVEFKVAFLGFSPGFPYLLGLPPRLWCARRAVPRVRVPAGSVAIAGKQAGIYPSESPGGWQLLGRTDAELFNPYRGVPALIKPGDRVRFERRPSRGGAPKRARGPDGLGIPALEILQPGFQSSVQDAGRFDHTHIGVSRGGAADPLAFRIGALLLGNPAGTTALEMTATGARVRFLRDTWIALTGAECDAELDGARVEMWCAREVKSGQVLNVGAISAFRTYLHVHGGISSPELLGGRGGFVSGGWGGVEIAVGTILCAGESRAHHPAPRPPALWFRRLYSERIGLLRVTRGPQWPRFERADDLSAADYAVTNEVSRLGLRLEGPPVIPADKEELLSEGVAQGSIQVPPSGQPMILFCEQCTTGGYPKIATVIGADLWRLGQLKPGDRVRFRIVSLEDAEAARRELEETLQRLGLEL